MSELTMFKNVLPSTDKEQEKLIAHLYKNKNEVKEFNSEIFTNALCHNLYLVFDSFVDNDIPFNIDNIMDSFSDYTYSKEQIDNLLKSEYIEENISIIRSKVEEINARAKTLHDVEKITEGLINNQKYDEAKIKALAENILSGSYSTEKDKKLLFADELMEHYKEKYEQRNNGVNILHSLGYGCINRLLTRPAGAGETTILFGNKGSGKSLLAKGIENLNINQKICVLSINLEMSAESNCDRLMSMRTNLSLSKEILNKELDRRNKERLMKEIERFSKYDNYIYYDSVEMTIDDYDKEIYKAKRMFKSRGVLPEDGYIFVTCDLLDMIEEFSDSTSSYELKRAMNKIHKINRKHGVHLLALVQSNENDIRNGKKFKDPDDCDNYFLQPENIEGGSVYGARARVILALNRPLVLKRRFFPLRSEEWDLEDDVITLAVVKQNDGVLGHCKFMFDSHSFRLHEYRKQNIENEVSA